MANFGKHLEEEDLATLGLLVLKYESSIKNLAQIGIQINLMDCLKVAKRHENQLHVLRDYHRGYADLRGDLKELISVKPKEKEPSWVPPDVSGLEDSWEIEARLKEQAKKNPMEVLAADDFFSSDSDKKTEEIPYECQLREAIQNGEFGLDQEANEEVLATLNINIGDLAKLDSETQKLIGFEIRNGQMKIYR